MGSKLARYTGEKGTAIWDGHGNPYAEVVDPASAGEWMREYVRIDAEVKPAVHTYHFGCLDEMFAFLEEGRRAKTDCRDNIHSMEMVLGAVESAKTGKKIDLAGLHAVQV